MSDETEHECYSDIQSTAVVVACPEALLFFTRFSENLHHKAGLFLQSISRSGNTWIF
jgi:hypothetical protein